MNTFFIDKQKVIETAPAANEKGSKDAKGKEAQKGKPKKGEKQDNNTVVIQLEPFVINWAGTSRELTTFKTFRQKSAHEWSKKVFEEFRSYFEENIKAVSLKFDNMKENEMKFEFQWEKNIGEIFRK